MLQHKYVVWVHGFCKSEDTIYLVMEHIEGISLWKWYSKEAPPISAEQKIRLITSFWQGLEHIHNMNYMHCDIHPGNILV